MAFNEEIKSNRLLQSRRFTQDALTDSQEAFTRVLDLGASEIYTRTDLIPTSSLPFSGSSQDQAIYSVDGKNILKYWYRQRLTPSDTLNSGETYYNTWFFISGSDYSSVNPGVIQPGQQVNFVSSKYAPSLGTANTEGTPPGYLVRLHNEDSDVIIDPATYTFDYKTGIVQFNEQSLLTVTADIRLTAYQYIGETLEDFILDGGGAGFPFSGSAVITGSLLISGSGITDELIVSGNVIATQGFTGSLFGTASYTLIAEAATVAVTAGTTNAVKVSDTTASAFLRPLFTSGTSGGNNVVYADGDDSITFNPESNVLNIGGLTGGIPTGSINLTGSLNILSGSITITSGSLIGTSSWALSASNAINAQTASYVNTLNQNVTVNGTLTAYTGSFNVLTVNYISSSVIYSSGSNILGDELSDSQTLSGSVYVVGPNFTWNNNTVITTADTASMTVSSASYASSSTSASYALNATNAQTASYVLNAVSASYALNATNASTASYVENAQTASYVLTAQTASYVLTAQTASYVLTAQTASYVLNAVSASYALNATNASTASYVQTAQTASYVLTAQTASYVLTAQTASYVLNAVSASYALNTTNASTASYVNTLTQDVTINGTTSTTNLTVTNNATITGDLTVNGETTFINVQNLLVEDKFILLNSGSLTNTPNEGGIIIQTTSSNGVAYGTALYYDQEANRWVVNRSGSVAWNATSSVLSVQSDFIVTVTGSVGAPTGTPVNFGSTNYSYGQMYINTSNSDIYIYA